MNPQLSAFLDRRPDVWRGDRFAGAALPAVASGHEALDRELPGGGWPRGALTEILMDGPGQGELTLLLPALVRLREEGGWTLLVAPPHPLHAPAWAAAGIDLARLVVVSPAAAAVPGKTAGGWPRRPDGEGPRAPARRGPAAEADALWALEQALASGAPAAVVAWSATADARAVRRLQVAAAAGRALAFLFRPARAAAEASAAPLRLRLAAGETGDLAVDILKRRGPPPAAPLCLDLPRPVRRHAHGQPLAGAAPSVPAATRSLRPAGLHPVT